MKGKKAKRKASARRAADLAEKRERLLALCEQIGHLQLCEAWAQTGDAYDVINRKLVTVAEEYVRLKCRG